MAPVWSVAIPLYEMFAGMVVLLPSRPMTMRRSHPDASATTRSVMAPAKCPSSRATTAVPAVGHRSQIHTSRVVKAKNSRQSRPAGPAPEDEGIAPIGHGEAAQLRLDDSAGMVNGPAPLVDLRAGDPRTGRGRVHTAPYASGEGSPRHSCRRHRARDPDEPRPPPAEGPNWTEAAGVAVGPAVTGLGPAAECRDGSGSRAPGNAANRAASCRALGTGLLTGRPAQSLMSIRAGAGPKERQRPHPSTRPPRGLPGIRRARPVPRVRAVEAMSPASGSAT